MKLNNNNNNSNSKKERKGEKERRYSTLLNSRVDGPVEQFFLLLLLFFQDISNASSVNRMGNISRVRCRYTAALSSLSIYIHTYTIYRFKIWPPCDATEGGFNKTGAKTMAACYCWRSRVKRAEDRNKWWARENEREKERETMENTWQRVALLAVHNEVRSIGKVSIYCFSLDLENIVNKGEVGEYNKFVSLILLIGYFISVWRCRVIFLL